ncbi:UPF0187 chloroplastic [Micractinium conductrix]|uniref:UPF0187 chloroplastic n=1 Tax=Micractinium conductrix TaxID=554055 RepID=A0A2P6VMC5_9CHLO|nr:UPF0187 chloroplastic [Micractinium conductrix]|eukprot:PSC75195.1 UPF0187 chloroplastic [Micractinium conductrix]
MLLRPWPVLPVAPPAVPPTAAAELAADRDESKEFRLADFRTVYTFESWASHRSTKRYLRHFMGILNSRILSGLRVPLLLIALEATAVCAYESALKNGLLPAFCQTFQACSYLSLGPGNGALLATLSRWMQAFAWVMKNYVRESKTWHADVGSLLRPAELAALLATPNPPLLTLQIITQVLDRMPISTKQRLRLDIFMTVASFSSVLLAFFLLTMEEIGMTIEEPFNILPLEAINTRVCAVVARYSQKIETVVSLVDDVTGMQRPQQEPPFQPVAEFATSLLLAQTDAARRQREIHGGLTMQDRGDDLVHVHELALGVIGQGPAGNPANLPLALVAALAPLTAAVAALTAGQAALQAAVAPLAPALAALQAGQAALQAGQAALQAGQAALQAQIFNVGRRAQNAATQNVQPRHSAVLAALAKEQLPPAGAVNAAAVGAMPPPGVFPVTWAALGALNHAQLNALSNFYGVNFGAANANAGGGSLGQLDRLQGPSRLPAGMMNLGNTCHLNAVLQVLLSLPSFVADLRHGRAALTPVSNYKQVYLTPASLKRALDAASSAFHGTLQQDAHELLCSLLDAVQGEVLAREVARLGRMRVAISETADPGARNFGFAVQHELVCSTCGHTSQMVEQYTHLSLELPPAQEEEVEKACEACGGASVAHALRHAVKRLPRVLVLHLKRFNVYTFESWASHRSTKRYLRHFMGILNSRILSGLRVPLLLIALEATAVCAYESALKNGLLPAFCQTFQAFPWVMKNYVRESKTWHADLGLSWAAAASLLRPAELAALLATPNPPLLTLQIITQVLDRMPISTKQRLRLDIFMTQLSDMVGAAERLITTPIPLSYTRHTARFLITWLVLTPFTISSSCGWVASFSSVLLAFFLLTMEEIGMTIEEPFNILPLEAINTRVCADVARYSQKIETVVSLVDDVTGMQRPQQEPPFQPVAEFLNHAQLNALSNFYGVNFGAANANAGGGSLGQLDRLQGPSRLPAGMMNLGNTCHLNAVLQVLLSLPSFVADLRHGRAALTPVSNYKQVYLTPASLKRALDAASSAFHGTLQQDAHELLCSLLDAVQGEVLAREVARLGRMRVAISETADPGARNFGFAEEEVEKACEACGGASVAHALRHAVKRLPRVLVLHLKRFNVYTFESWASHRSTKRYLRHFMGILNSRILSGLRVPLLLIALEATAVCAYESALKNGLLPAFCQTFQACSYLSLGPGNGALLATLSRWMQAFPWVMKNYVRESKTWHADLGLSWAAAASLLRPAELAALLATPNPPLLTLQIITQVLDRMPISTKQRLRLDIFMTQLSDMVGAAERLITTPIPLSYTRHTARFLITWLVLTPFTISSSCGWVASFSSVLLAFFLLTMEEIGMTIEEPFNILPLEAINTRVCADVARYSQKIETVVSLVDDVTGMQRPQQEPPFQPVAEFAPSLLLAQTDAARRQREIHGGLTMQDRGVDLVHVHELALGVIGQGPAGNPANLPPVLVAALAPLTAAVAALTAGQAALQAAVAPLAPALAALQAGQAALQAGQAALQAQIFNVGRRAQNAATQNVQPRHSAVLAALAKEQLPPAGAVNAAAVGAMPPPGVFPVTWAALGALNHAQLNALSNFYGVNFGAANANAGGGSLGQLDRLQGPSRLPAGMMNLGNTCHLNAVLQLPHTRQFEASAGRRLVRLPRHPAAGRHELLCSLLDAVQGEVQAREVARLGRMLVAISETADPGARNFGFAVQHELVCSTCGHTSQMVEQYTHLSLELPPSTGGWVIGWMRGRKRHATA